MGEPGWNLEDFVVVVGGFLAYPELSKAEFLNQWYLYHWWYLR